VGLVTGACLADTGHRVICVDVDRDKVEKINRAIPPIFEKGLDELLKRNVGVNLRATTDLHASVFETDLSLISVGTPFNGSEIDLTYIEQASRQIGEALRHKSDYHVVVVKSTVVPGTTDQVVRPLLERGSGKRAGPDFGLGMNPEFLREGEAIADFVSPGRIVIGGIDDASLDALEELYAPFKGVDVLRTNNKTAEMIKYTSNALLATLISFSNEIGNLCATLGGIDVVDVMRGVHLDERLSPILPNGERIVPGIVKYLAAGCGFGGSCFPKDVSALIAHGQKAGQSMSLLDAVMRVNKGQPQQILALLKKRFDSLKGLRVAVLGLAFKPGTDDIRESPAIPVIRHLLAEEATIKAYDPAARENAQSFFGNGNIGFYDDLSQTIEDTEAIVVLTRWEGFKDIARLLDGQASPPVVIDGRRMLDKHAIARYEGIGL
jgi:UDPglucose 6-dehydrogenase/GDP-mannose 6-dehydrogenase